MPQGWAEGPARGWGAGPAEGKGPGPGKAQGLGRGSPKTTPQTTKNPETFVKS